jgi:hypothetical protein
MADLDAQIRAIKLPTANTTSGDAAAWLLSAG